MPTNMKANTKPAPKNGVTPMGFPVTPVIPPTVKTGDVITASHENQVTQCLSDIWTNVQSITVAGMQTPWTQDIDAAAHNLLHLNSINSGGTPLGIGTTSPVAGFDFQGNINYVTEPSITFGTPAGWILQTGNLELAAARSNAGNCLWMQVRGGNNSPFPLALQPIAGYVGINTLAPQAQLHVGKDTYSNAGFNVGDPSGSSVATQNGMMLQGFSDGNNYIDSKTQTNCATVFRTGQGTESGGTREWLTVEAATGKVVLPANSGADNVNPRFVIAGGGAGTHQRAQIYSANGGAQDGWEVLNMDGSQLTGLYHINFANLAQLATSASAGLEIVSTIAPIIFGAGGSERMRIDTAGNVGIGTTSPNYPLDVVGTIHASTGFLTLAKGNQFGQSVGPLSAPANTDANILLYNATSTNWAGIGTDASGNMWFRTGISGSPDPRMVITNGGNVGIGTTSPTALLSLGNGVSALPVGTQMWIAGDGSNLDSTIVNRISMGVDTNQDYGVFIASEYFTTAPIVAAVLGTRNGGTDYNTLCLRQGNVGIGTTSPGSVLDLYAGGSVNAMKISANQWCNFTIFTANNGGGSSAAPVFNMQQSGGTLAAPTAMPGNCELYRLQNQIYDGSAWHTAAQLSIWGAVNSGNPYGIWSFEVSPAGSGGIQEYMRIDGQYQNVTIRSAVALPSLPSTAPAAGSKQLWYDPADGNRVKFAA